MGDGTAGTQHRMLAEGRGADVNDLPIPAYFAHAGGLNLSPANSMEALRNAYALSGDFPLDLDVKALADGALPLLHDSTTALVTSTSTNVVDLSGAAARRLRLDPARWFCNTWTDLLRVPDLTDVLREFGGRRFITAEVETLPGDTPGRPGARVADAIVAEGVERSVLVQSVSQANVQAVVARGVPACWLSAYGQHGNDIVAATAVAVGATWVGIDSLDLTNGAATIARFHAAGLKVGVYTVDRQTDRDRWLAVGADALWTSDPMWTSGTSPVRLTDPFKGQTFWHGHIPSTSSLPPALPRGYFAGGGWGIDAVGRFGSVLQGWASPIKGGSSRVFTIGWTTTWEAFGSAPYSRMDLFLSPTDVAWDDSPGARKTDGYIISTRPNGQIYVYRSSNANNSTTIVSSLLATPATQAVGVARVFRLTVTPTGLTLAVPALGAGYSVTTRDSTFGAVGYLHMGLSDAKGRFSAVTVS